MLILIIPAFLIRLAAVNYGLPQSFFGDELVQVAAGFTMLAEKTVRPNFSFYYLPPLFSYILTPIYALIGVAGAIFGVFDSLGDYKNFVLLNKEYFLMVGRIVSALFGAGAVYFTYAFAKRAFDEKIALLSAVLLAVDFLHVHESQVGRFWSPAVFFIIVSAYFLWRLYETDERKWYFWSAVSISLGFGIAYVPLLIAFWLPVAAYFSEGAAKGIKNLISQKFLGAAALLTALVGFFLWANTYAFYRQFGRSVSTVLDFFGIDTGFSIGGLSTASSFIPNIYRSFLYLWYDNPIVLIFGIAGILFLLFKDRLSPRNILIIGFPVIYILGVSATFAEFENRYVLPAAPFLIIGASFLFIQALRGGVLLAGPRLAVLARYSAVFFLALSLCYSLFVDLKYSFLLLRKDTRNEAIDWIYKNISGGSSILFGIDTVYLNNNRDGIIYQKEKNGFWTNTRDEYLLTLADEDFPKPNYFVFDLNHLPPDAIDLSKFTNGYYVKNFWGRGGEEAFILPDSIKKELIASFYPRDNIEYSHNLLQDPSAPVRALLGLKNLGPYVEIYRISNTLP